MKSRGITFKLIVFILTTTSIIFIGIFLYDYFFSRRIIKGKIRENASYLTQSMVNRIDGVLMSLEKIPQGVASFLKHGLHTREELLGILRAIVKNNPEIYGCSVAFEPYSFDERKLYFAPCFYKENNRVRLTYIGSKNYQYFYWDWYQLPKILNHAVWSEPYYGKGSDTVMSTYSVPFYHMVDGRWKFWGVVATNVSLLWLQRLVSSIKVAQTGYGFLISKNGTFVTHPHKKFIMNETIFTLAKETKDQFLHEIGEKMIHGQKGFVPINSIVTGKKCWLAYAPIPANEWSLGVLFPQKELMADITKLNRHELFLGIIGPLFLSGLIVLIAGTITKPLRTLTSTTKELAKGNLEVNIPYLSLRDEVGELARAFDHMRVSIKDYIKDLQETTAAKERVESELKIAADIQLSMLPRIFPPFPNRKEFDIFSIMEPAKEVGGDFYDFFFVDDDRLCFLIGDVSGKGVPASLFMAILKFLLKTEALRQISPHEILLRVNNTLYPDNETCMFATVFCGILDVNTGKIEFANGGHNPPVLWTKGGEVKFLDVNKGFVVGVFGDTSFKNESLVLARGDILLLYTDGVTEAMNPQGAFFSKERLKDVLMDLEERDVKQVVYAVRRRIERFVEGASQSDDITMLALRYNGREENA